MNELPLYISVSFILTTAATVFLLAKGTAFSRETLITILVWLLLQAIIANAGFYTVTDVMPPRFLLLVLPPLLAIAFLLIFNYAKKFRESFTISSLLLLHIVRIPVEFVLHWLFKEGTIPQLMTYEGRNFDIASGISAAMLYFLLIKGLLSRTVLLVWNFVCLGLLINIVALAIFSTPSPFQQLAFEQPNVAVLYFPFIWLPCFIVPAVLFSHLLMIGRLLKNKNRMQPVCIL